MKYSIDKEKIREIDRLPKDLKCLDSFIGDNSKLNEEFVYNLSYNFLLLLEYFRKKEIINNNIRIENIFISQENIFYLNDKIFEDEIFLAPEIKSNNKKKKYNFKNNIYSLALVLVIIITRKNINELDKINNKILFRRETGINIYYKNLLDKMLDPILRYRINSKKSLKYLLKIKKGKLKDPYDIQKLFN